MELLPRTTAPAHATGAVEFVPFAAIADDVTFRLREEGDVSALAASIGRLGQLSPVELRPLPGSGPDGPRWQVVAGFRRIAALRMLCRERVLARVHEQLDDEDAWALALGEALLSAPLRPDELEALRSRLAETGVAPWADELAEDALYRATAEEAESAAPPAENPDAALPAGDPEAAPPIGDPDAARLPGDAAGEPVAGEPSPEQEQTVEVELTPEELAEELATRLYEANQDLALAFESWKDLPPESRRLVLEQARYVAELFPHLVREDR